MQSDFPQRPTPPNPFLDTLREEMEHLIDRLRFNPSVGDMSLQLGVSGQMVPAVDLSENDTSLDITIEVPGIRKDDIAITINGDQLVLQGHKRDDRDVTKSAYHLVERRYGDFQRTIPLGFIPADDAVEAIFQNGVLRLTIRKPVKSAQTSRQIEIKGR